MNGNVVYFFDKSATSIASICIEAGSLHQIKIQNTLPHNLFPLARQSNIFAVSKTRQIDSIFIQCH